VNRLSFEDLVKLAAKSPKAKQTLLSMLKFANNSNTEFDEKVPSMEEENGNHKNGTGKEGEPPAEQNGGQAPAQQAAPVAAPAAQPEGPEMAGARAAHGFLGPDVMQAAMAGDPAAADLVARTAGQIAGAVSESILRSTPDASMMGTAGVPAQGGMPGQGAVGPGAQAVPAVPGAPATPEQDLANEIVPPPQAVAPAPAPTQGSPAQGNGNGSSVQPKNGNGQAPEKPNDVKGGGEQIDLKTVAKLIQAAKAGQI